MVRAAEKPNIKTQQSGSTPQPFFVWLRHRTKYTYDKSYQLTDEARSGDAAYDYTYDYDAAGNRERWTDNSTNAITTYSYDDANRLEWSQKSPGRTTYTYDADGNLVQKEEPSLQTDYTWDALNRMTFVDTATADVTFIYDGLGRRVEKQSSTDGTKKFVYDEQRLLQETDGDDDLTFQYESTLDEYGELLDQYDATGSPTGDTGYYAFDAQANTAALLDPNQTSTNEYVFTAFGEIKSQSGPQENPFTFVGQQNVYHDDEIELFFMGAGGSPAGGNGGSASSAGGDVAQSGRPYDFATARFNSKDPQGVDTDPAGNLYRYVANNPANATDPSGQAARPPLTPEDLIEMAAPIKGKSTVRTLAGGTRSRDETKAWEALAEEIGEAISDAEKKRKTWHHAKWIESEQKFVMVLLSTAKHKAKGHDGAFKEYIKWVARQLADPKEFAELGPEAQERIWYSLKDKEATKSLRIALSEVLQGVSKSGVKVVYEGPKKAATKITITAGEHIIELVAGELEGVGSKAVPKALTLQRTKFIGQFADEAGKFRPLIKWGGRAGKILGPVVAWGTALWAASKAAAKEYEETGEVDRAIGGALKAGLEEATMTHETKLLTDMTIGTAARHVHEETKRASIGLTHRRFGFDPQVVLHVREFWERVRSRFSREDSDDSEEATPVTPRVEKVVSDAEQKASRAAQAETVRDTADRELRDRGERLSAFGRAMRKYEILQGKLTRVSLEIDRLAGRQADRLAKNEWAKRSLAVARASRPGLKKDRDSFAASFAEVRKRLEEDIEKFGNSNGHFGWGKDIPQRLRDYAAEIEALLDELPVRIQTHGKPVVSRLLEWHKPTRAGRQVAFTHRGVANRLKYIFRAVSACGLRLLTERDNALEDNARRISFLESDIERNEQLLEEYANTLSRLEAERSGYERASSAAEARVISLRNQLD